MAPFDPNTQVVVNKGIGILLKPTLPASVVPNGTLTGVLLDRFQCIFKPGVTQPQIDSFNASQGTSIIRPMYFPNAFILKTPLDRKLEDVAQAYLSSNLVDNISPIFPMPPPKLPGEGARADQTFLRFPQAWDVTTGSQAILVALVDNGVDLAHPELVQNIAMNQGEVPDFVLQQVGDRNHDGTIDGFDLDADRDGIVTFLDLNDPSLVGFCPVHRHANTPDFPTDVCDPLDLIGGAGSWEDGKDNDGNGKTDDLVGWNFDKDNNNPMMELSQVAANADHGNLVAGTLGAVGDNVVGGTNASLNAFGGLAGNAWSVAIRVVRRLGTNSNDAFDAAYYATKLNPPPHILLIEAAGALLQSESMLVGAIGCADGTVVADFDGVKKKVAKDFDRMVRRSGDFAAESDVPYLTILPAADCGLNVDQSGVNDIMGSLANVYPSMINVTAIDFPNQPCTLGSDGSLCQGAGTLNIPDIEIAESVAFGNNTIQIGAPIAFNTIFTDVTNPNNHLFMGKGFFPGQLNGTSGASANLAGVAALVGAAFPATFNGAKRDPCRWRNHLLGTAASPSTLRDPRPNFNTLGNPGNGIGGHRILDAFGAVSTDPSGTASCP